MNDFSISKINLANIELQQSLDSIILLVKKCTESEIVSIVFYDNNAIFSLSNSPILDEKTFERKFNTNLIQEFEQILLQNELCANLIFLNQAIIIKNGKQIGHINIAVPNDQKITDHSSLLHQISEITSTMIEKHLEVQNISEVFTDFVHKSIHDLKNPFTSISLTTELLKRRINEPEKIEILIEKLETTNNKVFKNLEKLLSTFPTKKETFKLVVDSVDMSALLREIKEENFHHINIDENGLNLRTDKKVLKDALISLLTHLSIIDCAAISVTTEISETLMTINTISYPTANVYSANYQTNALTIGTKLIEMLDGKLTTNYTKENTYTICIELPL